MDNRQEKLVEKVFDAAMHDDFEKVKQLIESGGVSITVDRGFGDNRETLAHIAAQRGNLDMLKYFINADSSFLDVDEGLLNPQPRTILETAVIHGRLNIVKYLVETHKNDVFKERFIQGHNCSPVTWAIVNGHLNILKYFIEELHMDINTGQPREEDQNREYYNLRPLLFQAVEYKRNNISNYLIDKKVNLTMLDENDRNVLYIATSEDDLNFIKQVLDVKKAEIDINWRDKEGKTLVYFAVEDNHKEILQYLVEEKHADVNIPENEKHWTPLHQAIYAHFEVFKYLVDHGAGLENRDKEGATPLHLAAAQKFYNKKCKYLLERGASVTQKNNKGETPLDIAIANNNRNASEYIVEYCDVNERNNNGETLLHTVAARNQIELLDYLVSKKNAEVNVARKSDQWTPLHCAASWDHDAVCKYLIEHGADPQARDSNGKSPAQVASKEEVIKYLQNASPKARSRRSVGHSLWMLTSFQSEPNKSTHHLVSGDSYRRASIYYTSDIQPFQFQNILAFANFVIRYFIPSSINTSGIEAECNHPSVAEISWKGVDPVAEDAVHNFMDFGKEGV